MQESTRRPEWRDGPDCELCRVPFTLMRRKHHCRNCGALVCGYCANHYEVVPDEGPTPVRVCDNCVKLLKAPIQQNVKQSTAPAQIEEIGLNSIQPSAAIPISSGSFLNSLPDEPPIAIWNVPVPNMYTSVAAASPDNLGASISIYSSPLPTQQAPTLREVIDNSSMIRDYPHTFEPAGEDGEGEKDGGEGEKEEREGEESDASDLTRTPMGTPPDGNLSQPGTPVMPSIIEQIHTASNANKIESTAPIKATTNTDKENDVGKAPTKTTTPPLSTSPPNPTPSPSTPVPTTRPAPVTTTVPAVPTPAARNAQPAWLVRAAIELIVTLSGGLWESLHLHQAVSTFRRSSTFRNRTSDVFILNIMLLALYQLLVWGLIPIMQYSLFWKSHNSTTVYILACMVYYLLISLYWINMLLVFVLSVIMTAHWYEGVANGAYGIYVIKNRNERGKTVSTGNLGTSIYRFVLFNLLLGLGFVISLLPTVGKPLYFLVNCWVSSVYAYEYKWNAQQWDLSRKAAYFESRWLYFIGFGTPITATTFFFDFITSYALVSILFTILIPMSMYGNPRKQNVWGAIPVSRAIDRVLLPLTRWASARFDRFLQRSLQFRNGNATTSTTTTTTPAQHPQTAATTST